MVAKEKNPETLMYNVVNFTDGVHQVAVWTNPEEVRIRVRGTLTGPKGMAMLEADAEIVKMSDHPKMADDEMQALIMGKIKMLFQEFEAVAKVVLNKEVQKLQKLANSSIIVPGGNA